ncbi:uncharacterized protein LOC127686344 [Apodemus sylvaticus]|uniref:uncharacterized protein LOC127686344 n=1 Tax=Apodemus sylvaticus TaxID=10129 RepID=UPI0022437A73|nr:uncharacterized protein LOC127686344 [Apodemus sylvaticus]
MASWAAPTAPPVHRGSQKSQWLSCCLPFQITQDSKRIRKSAGYLLRAKQYLRRKFGATLNNARVPVPVAIKWSRADSKAWQHGATARKTYRQRRPSDWVDQLRRGPCRCQRTILLHILTCHQHVLAAKAVSCSHTHEVDFVNRGTHAPQRLQKSEDSLRELFSPTTGSPGGGVQADKLDGRHLCVLVHLPGSYLILLRQNLTM